MKNKLIIFLTVLVSTIFIFGCGKSNRIKINSVSDLKNITTNYETTTTYVLTKDLNLKDIEWEPLKDFYGTFDGQNHKITGLKITTSASGLFTSVHGTIKNLSVEGEIIASYSGMIAGRLDEGGLLKNCKSSGIIKGDELKYVGGLVGTLVNGEIIDCKNYANITGTTKIGGIVGDSWSKYTNVTIKNCENYGEISGTNYVGGIVGNVLADASLSADDQKTYGDKYTYITRCLNAGKVSATSNFVGGIIGCAAGTESTKIINSESVVANGYVSLTNLTNNGEVNGADSVGGIIGHETKWVSEFKNCTNNASIKGNNYIGGIVGRNRSRQIDSVTNNGEITGLNYVGGIAGETSSIVNSKNYGSVSANRYVGGVAGSLFGETDSSNLENHGAINSNGSYTGGIIGYGSNSNASLKNSNNYGIVSSTSTSYIDGIMGYHKNINIENCFDYSNINN